MYRIVGADQKEYGPVSADQIRAWIAEGRANGQTLIKFEDGPWKPLSTFPEFLSSIPSSPSSAPPPLASPPSAPASGAPKNNTMAITGLVFGILSLFCCPPFFALLGLIFSTIGLYQINQNPTQQTGKALAIIGIITSILGFIVFVGFIRSGLFLDLNRHLRHLLRS